MKTSQFRKYLEENWNFKETEEAFEISNLAVVYKNSDKVCFEFRMHLTSELPKKIIEYAQTPLEEREEEKKYYLMFPKDFASVKLYLKHSYSGYDRTHDKNAYHEINTKTQFTQKEIDAMPFDTNFFIKEEVK